MDVASFNGSRVLIVYTTSRAFDEQIIDDADSSNSFSGWQNILSRHFHSLALKFSFQLWFKKKLEFELKSCFKMLLRLAAKSQSAKLGGAHTVLSWGMFSLIYTWQLSCSYLNFRPIDVWQSVITSFKCGINYEATFSLHLHWVNLLAKSHSGRFRRFSHIKGIYRCSRWLVIWPKPSCHA